jgi:hypothetical protein
MRARVAHASRERLGATRSMVRVSEGIDASGSCQATRRLGVAGICLLVLLGELWQPSGTGATSVVPLDDLALAESAVGIVLGRVARIESVHNAARGRLFTLVRVVVEESLKGEFPDGEITLRQLGGSVGDLRQWIDGNPEFVLGERVLLFLDQDRDGNLRVAHLFQGKYGIAVDPETGEEYAVRGTPAGVRAVAAPTARVQEAPRLHDARPLQAFTGQIRRILGTLGADHGPPRRALPSVAPEVSGVIQAQESFAFMDPPARWFEPDSDSPVSMRINSAGEPLAPTQGFEQVRAAFQAWSTVPGSSFRYADGGFTTAGGFNGDGVSAVSFGDPEGEIQNPTRCAGTLGLGGFYSSGQTRTVNGTTFHKITEGDVVFNDGWDGCGFYESFANLAEVATHELGHVLGLGHSSDPDATMYSTAHWDGRGAALRADDENGLRAIYPSNDSTPPDTTILSGPTGSIAATTAIFTWTGSDDQTPAGSLLFATRLAPLEADFSAFGSATSKTYSALAAGSYTFSVKARDLAGNEDPTPETRAFTVAVPVVTLTVSKAGSADGVVTSSPAGISCGGACSAGVASGSVVTLSASPVAGSAFRQWRGACSGTSATCLLTVSTDTSITAVFSKAFTDDPLVVRSTSIKAAHITELRSAIDTLRVRHALAPFAWTTPTLSQGGSPVQAQHVLDLRTALTAASQAAGRGTPSFAEAISARQTVIKASHLSELRSLVRGLE